MGPETLCLRSHLPRCPAHLPPPRYVTAGYWYTSSTSFANPAVTLGRCFTDTFASINPSSYGHFVGGQLAGFAVAMPFVSWMFDGADVVDALGVLLRRPTAGSGSASVAHAVKLGCVPLILPDADGAVAVRLARFPTRSARAAPAAIQPARRGRDPLSTRLLLYQPTCCM